jgi:hypothetical protein
MKLQQIIEQCKKLDIVEERTAQEDYAEFVFRSKQVEQWIRILEELLGPPLKKAHVKPTRQMQDLTKEFGGIWDDQTLFKKDFEGFSVMAMFWPWQDGEHITFKLALVKK